VNAVTRSCTNDIEGSVYRLFRSSDLVGKTVNGGIRLPPIFVDEKTIGLELANLIIKNKLFIFGKCRTICGINPRFMVGKQTSPVQRRCMYQGDTAGDLKDSASFMRKQISIMDLGQLDNFNNDVKSTKGLALLGL
jgi:hypothetical protein